MKLRRSKPVLSRAQAATLAEVMIAVLVLGVMMISLYAGFMSGFTVIQLARENLRATQIMLERMETIRLYRWDQVTNSAFIPTAFTNYYYPPGLATGAGGIVYTGALAIGSAPATLPAQYRNDMRQITVQLNWVSRQTLRQRQMTTLVARYGLQNYVYNPTNNF